MEDPHQCEKITEFLRICQFLSTIYPRLRTIVIMFDTAHREKEMGMGRRTRRGFQRIDKETLRGTDSLDDLRRGTHQNRGGWFWFCNGSSVIARTNTKPNERIQNNRLYVRDIQFGRAKLSYRGQRTFSNCQNAKTMETISIGKNVRGLVRSQKPPNVQKTPGY